MTKPVHDYTDLSKAQLYTSFALVSSLVSSLLSSSANSSSVSHPSPNQ